MAHGIYVDFPFASSYPFPNVPNILLPIQAGTLPPDVCYGSEQERLVAFSANQWAVLQGSAFYNYGDTEPAPEFRSYPWLRTTDMRWYQYSGQWRTPYNLDANERRLYVGTLTDLITYDGGSAGVVTAESGPAWVEDEDFRGRSPMGVGDISGSDPAKTLALDEDYGSASTDLTVAQLPAHHHTIKFATNDTGSGFPSGSTGNLEAFEETTEDTGSGDPVQVVHPVRGLYIIKPSGRLYRTVS